MGEPSEIPQLFILKTRAGQWMWELSVDGEIDQAGAGYASQGDAIEGAQEALQHVDSFNLVLTPEAGD